MHRNNVVEVIPTGSSNAATLNGHSLILKGADMAENNGKLLDFDEKKWVNKEDLFTDDLVEIKKTRLSKTAGYQNFVHKCKSSCMVRRL